MNAEVTGVECWLGKRKTEITWPRVSRATRCTWLGRLGVACLACLTKYPAPTFPRRNLRPRALMDLGASCAQPEMASNTGL